MYDLVNALELALAQRAVAAQLARPLLVCNISVVLHQNRPHIEVRLCHFLWCEHSSAGNDFSVHMRCDSPWGSTPANTTRRARLRRRLGQSGHQDPRQPRRRSTARATCRRTLVTDLSGGEPFETLVVLCTGVYFRNEVSFGRNSAVRNLPDRKGEARSSTDGGS
jgi:hypothetical protein